MMSPELCKTENSMMFPELCGIANCGDLAGFLLFGRQDLLNAHLIDKVLPAQIPQMLSLVIIGQIGSHTLGHGEHQCSIAHIEPEGSANQLSAGVPCEGNVGRGAQIRIIEITH